jgi:ribosomal protein S8
VEVYLKYFNEGNVMHSIDVYSRPGRRVFVTASALKKMASINPGNIIFISTSAGILNHFQALRAKTGGMLLYKIH